MLVTVNPATITLTPGGPPVVQTITIADVPSDATVSQPLTVQVGANVVVVTTTVAVDNPSPSVSGASAAPSSYTVSYSSPVQDAANPTRWTAQATYSAT